MSGVIIIISGKFEYIFKYPKVMSCRGSSFNCGGNNDKLIKMTNNAFGVYKGRALLYTLSICNFEHPYENYCGSSVMIQQGGEYYLDQCNLGLDAELLIMFVDYGEYTEDEGVNKGIMTYPNLWQGSVNEPPNSRYRQGSIDWREPNDIEWKSMGQLLVLSGHSSSPVNPIHIKNPNAFPVELNFLIATMNPSLKTLRSDNRFIMQNNVQIIENISRESVISEEPHTIKIIKAGKVEAAILIDQITHTELNDKILIIEESSAGKTYLHFATRKDALQVNSSLFYLFNNRNDHLSSTEKSFSLPLPEDNEPPKIVYFDNTVQYHVDKRYYVADILLDSFDHVNINKGVITKENLIDYFVKSCTDNRDGIVNPTPSHLSIMSNDIEVDEIKGVGLYTLHLTISDMSENILEDKIQLSVSFNV